MSPAAAHLRLISRNSLFSKDRRARHGRGTAVAQWQGMTPSIAHSRVQPRMQQPTLQPSETRMLLIAGGDVRAAEAAALSLFSAGHVPVMAEWFAFPLIDLAFTKNAGTVGVDENRAADFRAAARSLRRGRADSRALAACRRARRGGARPRDAGVLQPRGGTGRVTGLFSGDGVQRQDRRPRPTGSDARHTRADSRSARAHRLEGQARRGARPPAF